MLLLVFDTPFGPMGLGEAEAAICRLYLPGIALPPAPREETALLAEGRRQLTEYFSGQRRTFSLPLRPEGTPFQQRVWAALREIPWGQVRTYRQIAAALGSPRSCRAVGMANHRNPLPILIPCHRVVGSSGALTGYAGGLALKAALLTLEGAPFQST